MRTSSDLTNQEKEDIKKYQDEHGIKQYQEGEALEQYLEKKNIPFYKPIYYDTLVPYQTIEHTGIQYNVCYDFDHISRYKGLRQLTHNPGDEDRFITLETPNPILSNAKFNYYDVPRMEENRLDLIAYKFYGSAQYSWIVAYFNGIEDGFTVSEGQRLRILENFTDLFNNGELLAAIPALQLNLGSE